MPYFFYSRPEGIPKASGCVQDLSKTWPRHSLNHSFLIPFDSFSFLAGTFSKKNRPNSCPFQSYCIPLPSLQFLCGALRIVWRCKIINKGRGYMFKPDQLFFLGYGLIFLPVICRISMGYALCLCGALRIVWRCKIKIYGGSPSTCFYCPLWRKA